MLSGQKSVLVRFLAATSIVCGLVTAANPAAARATVWPDESKLTPATIGVLHHLRQHFPEIPAIGGWRPDPIPDHPSGKALDVMVYGDKALGDRIHADLTANRERLGIRYMLWRVRDHFDHIHVCVH